MSKASKILVVDDSSIQAMVLQRLLEQRGYGAYTAKSGRDGLALVRQDQPTLVISAIAIPDMDGYELCRAIKQDPTLSHIPVILLTSLTDPEDIIKGVNAGADNYVAKPYNEELLLARIENLISTMALRPYEREEEEMEVFFAGKTHVVRVDRRQVLDLLLSTFEGAVQKNQELVRQAEELHRLKKELDTKKKPEQAEAAAETQATPSSTPDTPTKRPLRILLAEDNRVNQKLISRMLQRLGYQIDVVGNGRELLDSLQRQSYDVVLTDIQMPEMDGDEAARQIVAQWSPEQRPRIIAMTGHDSVEDRKRFLEMGMDDYVCKPVRPDELKTVLSKCRPLPKKVGVNC
ncbi:MAG: response regulator [Anaerolineae bacterium]